MRSLIRPAALALASGWVVTAAMAQTTGTPIETAHVPLPPEKQVLVKEYVTRSQPPAAVLGEPVTVGTSVPENAELFVLPQDNVTEVPRVTRSKFLRTNSGIAVVDAETRRAIQIISN